MLRRSFLAAAGAPLLTALPLDEFPLAVTTDEIDEDFGKAVTFLREFRLRHAEIRNLWGQYNTSQPLDKVKEARKIMDDAGVRLAILDTGFFKIPLPPDTPEGRGILDNQWSLLDRAMERAKILGTSKIRVFAFNRPAGADQGDPKDLPRIYELVTEAARRAKKRGFMLGLENVGGSYVSTGAESAALFKAVKEDSLGLTWDPNNAASRGEKAFPDGYRLLDKARIVHIHLRDYKSNGKGGTEWCAVGDGEFDNVGQIRALRRDGFRGTYSLETHWKSPKGKEHATRTSLAALLRVVAQV